MPDSPPVLRVADFSGGLNLRDSPTDMEPKYAPLMWNVTLDEKGGVTARSGYSKWNTSSYGGSPPSNLFYWSGSGALGHSFVQVGASVYQDLSTTPIKTFTTSDRAAFADFAGKVCMLHPVDGLFTWDGAVIAAIGAGPKGNTLAVFQNKLWANDTSGTNYPRVNFSAAGDPTLWPGTIDIREKDTAQVVCLIGTAGTDIVGKPSLIVLKNRSAYRIYDSATGAYTTIDWTAGAASALSAVQANTKVYVLSDQGVFQTDGVGPLQPVSDVLRPLWTPDKLAVSYFDKACAGSIGTKAYFSFPLAGSTVNNYALELDVTSGAFTANSNAASCYALHLAPTVGKLLFGSPTVNGQLYQLNTGGTDDGANITSKVMTKWIEPNSGMEALLNRVRVNGRGSFTLYPVYDYSTATNYSRTISLSGGSSTIHSQYQDIYDLGRGKAFAFYAEATTSTSGEVPFESAAIGATSRTVGPWAIYSIDINDYAPLGRA